MKGIKKASISYLSAVFALSLGSSILLPIIPFYIIDLHLSMSAFGAINSTSQALVSLVSFLMPILMPLIGYFRTFALGASLILLSRLAYVGSVLLSGSLTAFAIGYLLSSLRMPVIFTSRTALVAEYIPSKRRATAMGVVSAIAMLASCVGPYVGSYLYESLTVGYLGVFLLSLMVTNFSLVPLIPLTIEDPTRKGKIVSLKEEVKFISRVTKLPKLRIALSLFALDAFTWSLIGPFISIYYAKELKALPYELATVTLITNVISIVMFPFSGAISDKVRQRVPFLALSEAIGVAYYMLILIAKDMKLIYVASSLLALIITFWGPLAGTLITELAEEVDKSLVPSAISAWSSLRQVIRIPASVLGGLLFDIDPKLPFKIVIALLLILTILLITLLTEGEVKG